MDSDASRWTVAGIDQTEEEEWVSAGFRTPTSASKWHKVGFRAAEAAIWRHAGWPPGQSATLRQNDVQPADAAGWKKLGWDTYWVMSAAEKRIPFSIAKRWSELGFEPYQTFYLYPILGDDPETALTWQDVIGTLNESAIAGICKAGLSRDAAEQWLTVGLELAQIPRAVAQGVTPEEVKAWRDAGFVFSLAGPAIAAGATLDDALAFLAAGYTERSDWAPICKLLALGLRAQDAKAFAAAAVTLSRAQYYVEQGLTVEQIKGWFAQGVDGAFVLEFAKRGIKEPVPVADWLAEGFSASEAATYIKGGIGAAAAAHWRARGFLAAEAIERTNKGGSYETSEPPLAGSSWRAGFSRSKIDRDVFVVSPEEDIVARLWSVCRSLGVQSKVSVQNFSTRHEAQPFLDGGIVDVSPPYFFGLRGTWVVGFDALCLLCCRLGLKAPSLRDHRPPRSCEELEKDLKAQRSRGRRMLKARLKQMLAVGSSEGLKYLAAAMRGDPLPERHNYDDPADGALGEAGFTWQDAERVHVAGMSDSAALRWRQAGILAWETGQLAGRSLEEVLAWRSMGLENIFDIRALLDAEIPLDTGRRLIDAGCPPDGVVHALTTLDVPPDDRETWWRSGLDGGQIKALVSHHIAASEASRWYTLRAPGSWQWSGFLSAGGTISQAEALYKAGAATEDWYGWATTGAPADESAKWAALGVPPITAQALWEASVSLDETARHWHKGTKHRPNTIIAAVQRWRLEHGT